METFCPVCYGSSLTYEHGVLVCDDCGAQTQTIQQETEFQQGIDDVRGKRRAAGSAAAGQQLSQAAVLAQEEQQAEQLLQEVGMLYARCLQHLLKAQGQCLQQTFGVSPQLSSLLRQMWLSLLPSTGLLEPQLHNLQPGRGYLWLGKCDKGPAGAAVDHEQDEDDNDSDGDGGDDDDEENDSDDKPARKGARAVDMLQPFQLKKLLWKVLHPQVTLQLCFLGCLLLREALTFYDIMCWALDGQLPFLNLPTLSRELAGQQLATVLPVRVLQAQLTLNPLSFCAGCCRLANHLDLKLPPVPGEALLLRGVMDLGLPKVVHQVALQLYFLYLLGCPTLKVACRRNQQTPYTWLAAVLLVAIKLLFGLGSASGQLPLLAKAAGPPGGWQHWAESVMSYLPGISSLPLTQEQVLQLDSSEVRQYIDFCRHNMFAGQPVVSTMDDVQRLLAGWYEESSAGLSLPAAAAQPRHRPAAPAAQDSQPAAAAGLTSTCHAAAAGAEVTAATEAAASTAAAETASAAAGSLELASNYNLTIGYKRVVGTSRMEPHLAAVVVVLAAYSHVSPAALMSCARSIEKQMVSVETAVKAMRHLQQLEQQQQQQQQEPPP